MVSERESVFEENQSFLIMAANIVRAFRAYVIAD
jgi:hypothetical protein